MYSSPSAIRTIWAHLSATAALAFSVLNCAFAATLPSLPQTYINTDYSYPSGAVISVAAGGNLQAALDNAKLGDKIVLQSGATYTGPFRLPNKTTGSGWIYVVSSAYDRLPAPGTRVSPGDAVNMPTIQVGTGGISTIETADGAHHFRFVGIEFRPNVGAYVNTLIAIGGNDTSLATMPSDIVFDRCFVHGDPAIGGRRGFALNGIRVAVVDSYVADFKEDGADTQAVWAYNTPGPLKVVNNYLEAAGENLMIGGAEPRIQNMVPSDIEIRDNHFYKPTSWVGSKWTIKNLIEFKLGVRALVHRNIFENNWAGAQVGFAVQLTPRNEGGNAPWAVTKDITFTSNRFINAGSGFNISGADTNFASQRTERVLIKNNVIDANAFGNASGRIFQIINGPVDLTIENNTQFGVQDWIYVENITAKGLRFTLQNNITTHGRYGIMGTGTGIGQRTVDGQFVDWSMLKNAVIGAQAAGLSATDYPAGNYFPTDIPSVQFVDFAGGNLRLAANSPYKGAGTDGKDLGADIDSLPIRGSVAAPPIIIPRPPTAIQVQ